MKKYHMRIMLCFTITAKKMRKIKATQKIMARSKNKLKNQKSRRMKNLREEKKKVY
jgi:hypothetical protein